MKSGTKLRCAVFASTLLTAGSILADAKVTDSANFVHASSIDAHASGIFINDAGMILTARHAINECKTVYVVKDARVVQAKVYAVSDETDLAILQTTLKPYLSATLPLNDAVPKASQVVFAEAYSVLQRLSERNALLSNSVTVPGKDGLQLLSGVKQGASGSGVLGNAGLLLGMVVERVAQGSMAGAISSGTALSKSATKDVPTGSTVVRAVDVIQIKQFLRMHAVPFSASDQPQLGPYQSPAGRANTLSVGVICG